ncbi:acyl-CoA dehydrogenase [Hydrogenophaga sp.]|uniref:acyl-CoA dehydrogenase n=1 Tax=Hydrogenophaga sp. TaxID=1904254 RepID=UPI0026382BC6|nr:acyl-CoA dehydrogenase [Hydrogenophaga sp.]MCW5653326.1 acyl-CoA dehydrogenase [Hydrogenophaga sp.]
MSASSTHPTINRRDLDFQLFEVLGVERLTQRPVHADHDRQTFAAVLDTAQAVARDKFQPHYREADLDEPRLENGKVRVVPQVKEALKAFADAGFMNADRPYEEDGQQLPFTLLQASLACFQAANIGTSSYNFLTISGAAVIRAFGTERQRRLYMQPMLAARFLGTMCLSEPHAGSGLADIRTRAIPQPDGGYRIKGSKMWISAGEHELSENIVHLVLARIDGAPAGTRGISLFIVPRRRVAEDGSVGADNGVTLVGLNHKMGYRGTVNTLLSFGDDDDCMGELIGEPHNGLSCMFHMMNEARISVGVGATMLGIAGYLYSLDYAKNRPQGRLPGAKDPATPPVPIVEHADIRRMLVTQKSYAEGALGLCLYAATLVDDVRSHEDTQARERAALLLEILTPIVKSWPSEFCLEANKLAMQVLGGYGYTRDYPVEQFYRDNRLNLIHEGTHGIQAMDLVGRKIRMQDGAALRLLFDTIRADIAACPAGDEAVGAHARQLDQALDDVEAATRAMQAGADNERVYLANATCYLDMFGHVVIAWMWLRQASVASLALAAGASGDDRLFYQGKLAACRYFYDFELGRLRHWLPLLASAHPLFAELDTEVL